ncbi:pyrroline-5-carboxylate reductase [Spiroplasma gladiatoris]|uniref:Pyrroline-5-carboxylate reductase n=1 Tax=Spiroplasma gladiatoris TaxID=2143 RepID=A0A4P7AJJ2_9MOLU|nr:pyrroline-5-carboxylate reductase dimerization domain-containing protein [Spiroplasma gladiatoris]QBQ07700.1 pyrroline-5-carboxylate reductase [Spiroplasma gladiatoris]
MKKILIIGTGHMGEAILKSLSKNLNKDFYEITILNRTLSKSIEFSNKYKCNYIKNLEEINYSDYHFIFLGFRPVDADGVLNKINLQNHSNTIIISMLNAFKISEIEKYFEKDINVLRIMPNMNANIDKSTTSYCFKAKNIHLLNEAIKILNVFGKTYLIEEEQFASFVALTGSAPAFIYEFIKAFKEYAFLNNYKEEISNDFIKETIIGSTMAALENSISLDEMIKKIIVPNGPTEFGHNTLIENNFKEILIKCFENTKSKA